MAFRMEQLQVMASQKVKGGSGGRVDVRAQKGRFYA